MGVSQVCLIGAYPAVMLVALFVSISRPRVDTVPQGDIAVQAAVPANPIKAGACDFGKARENTFRCGVGTGLVVKTHDGRNVLISGPFEITFGKL